MTAKFDYDDVVRVTTDAPSESHPGEKAWIVGVFEVRPGAYFKKFPVGAVYTIEFENGASIEIHEKYLVREPMN